MHEFADSKHYWQMPRYVLALDQGTTSSRAVLFDSSGQPCFQAQRPIRQSYPRPGWVEHAPLEIWESILSVGQEVMDLAGIDWTEIAAIGITNQRETTVVWDKSSGDPVYPAIVWQDRRTAEQCQALRDQGWSERVRAISGLELDPYFSATKLAWVLENHSKAQDLAFGTVDSWLLWKLTEGAVHATDLTNASRTMLLDLDAEDWSVVLLERFGIEREMLPAVHGSSHRFGVTTAFGGRLPITGVAGDQQAALFGQACFKAGMTKCTYGTGAFILTYAGNSRRESAHRLLTSRSACVRERAGWVIEGSVFAAGSALNWLCGTAGLYCDVIEAERAAESVDSTEGVTIVPAFAGLGAPHWDAEARGAILGLTLGTGSAHLSRALFESIAFQVADVLRATEADLGQPVSEVRVDGGVSQSDLLLQLQADLLGLPVIRSRVAETTALGVAFLAGLEVGFWSSIDEVASLWKAERVFTSQISDDERSDRVAGWHRAVAEVRREASNRRK